VCLEDPRRNRLGTGYRDPQDALEIRECELLVLFVDRGARVCLRRLPAPGLTPFTEFLARA
jgi:hypothetical protein